MFSKFLSIVALLVVASSTHCLQAQVLVDPDTPNITITISGSSSFDDQGDIRFATLLSDSSILDQIEMVDYQREEIKKSIQEIGKLNFEANQALVKTLRSQPTAEKVKTAQEEYFAATQVNQRKFEKVAKAQLLPHQVKAIGAIAFSKQLTYFGIEGFFSSAIATSMGLTKEEKQKVIEKAKEVDAELVKKIAKLKREALEEILNELPKEKVALMKRRFGDSFDGEKNKN